MASYLDELGQPHSLPSDDFATWVAPYAGKLAGPDTWGAMAAGVKPFVRSTQDTASFGLRDRIASLFPGTTLAEEQRRSREMAEAHPTATNLGVGAGIAASMLGLRGVGGLLQGLRPGVAAIGPVAQRVINSVGNNKAALSAGSLSAALAWLNGRGSPDDGGRSEAINNAKQVNQSGYSAEAPSGGPQLWMLPDGSTVISVNRPTRGITGNSIHSPGFDMSNRINNAVAAATPGRAAEVGGKVLQGAAAIPWPTEIERRLLDEHGARMSALADAASTQEAADRRARAARNPAAADEFAGKMDLAALMSRLKPATMDAFRAQLAPILLQSALQNVLSAPDGSTARKQAQAKLEETYKMIMGGKQDPLKDIILERLG